MEPIDDSVVPFYAFKFTSYDEIFKVKNEDSHLIGIFKGVFFFLKKKTIAYLFVIVFFYCIGYQLHLSHFCKILLEYYLQRENSHNTKVVFSQPIICLWSWMILSKYYLMFFAPL